MKKTLLSLTLIIFLSPIFAQHAYIEQSVIEKLATANENELIPVFLIFNDAVDINALEQEIKTNKVPVNERAKVVMQTLKAKSRATQPQVIDFIESSGLPYSGLQQFWITNVISLNANAELIHACADLEAIARIDLNIPQFSLTKPEKAEKLTDKSVGGIEPGLAAIGAPEMWAMGYTGYGRLALTFDTGTFPDHPAFDNRYLVNRMPYAATWFAYDSPVPTDKSSSHGTHVSGTILGLDTANADTIGVAFGAYLIATDPIVSDLADVKPLSEIMLGFEWAMNPDGDENTSSDIPDVINNSWGRDNTVVNQDWTVCSEVVADVFTAVQASGIANVFSAGNEGPNAATIGIPHNINTGLVNSFTVAAVSANAGGTYPIAEFSSRGPSLCEGEGSILIKPEVSAPGVNVRSSIAHGAYASFSGTSMASPHVSGAVLLLKEAFPFLSGEEILLALYYSATDLGTVGEDNTYGMGLINVKDAFDYLAVNHTPEPPVYSTDLDLTSIDYPTGDLECGITSNGFSPIITVTNKGINDVTGITVYSRFNDGDLMTYTDNEIVISAGSQTQITLDEILYTSISDNELHIWIEGLENETDIFNNHNIKRWRILPEEEFSIFTEDFENELFNDRWTVLNHDQDRTWTVISDILQINDELGTVASMNFIDYYPIENQKDHLISPLFSIPTDTVIDGPVFVSFDMFYRRGGSNIFTQDTLAIYVRQQCNDDPLFTTEIFRRGGTELYTVSEGAYALPPQSTAEWQNIQLSFDLVEDAEDRQFYIQFEGINRRGNHLMIDNINISLDENVGITNAKKAIEFSIYPNPTSGLFTLETEDFNKAETLTVYDVYGRKVYVDAMSNSQNTYDLSQLGAGVYLVTIDWKEGSRSAKKLVIQ